MPLCTPAGADCVRALRAADQSCLYNCQGIITGVITKHTSLRSNQFIDNLIDDYDSYKSSDYSKIYFIDSLKGLLESL